MKNSNNKEIHVPKIVSPEEFLNLQNKNEEQEKKIDLQNKKKF